MNQPIELFDGFEPDCLLFDPADYGYANLEPVDLREEAGKKYKSSKDYETYRRFYEENSNRVVARDKSSHRDVELSGYFAALKEKDSARIPKIMLYSFFEVSPSRYHAYLHRFIDFDEETKQNQSQ